MQLTKEKILDELNKSYELFKKEPENIFTESKKMSGYLNIFCDILQDTNNFDLFKESFYEFSLSIDKDKAIYITSILLEGIKKGRPL